MKKATSEARKSDSGIEHHTPQLPSQRVWTSKIWGRKISPGIRNSSWRESDRKIALPAMPMLMKKLVATIWNPMIGKQMKTIRIPSTARRISSGSFVKADTASRGASSPIRNPAPVTHVAPMIVILINKGLKQYGGDLMIGAYGIVNRLAFFFVMIVMGINQGMQPLSLIHI